MPDTAGDQGCIDADCCCDASPVENSSAVEFGDHRLDPAQQTVRAAAFKLLLESGQPADMASIAEAAGVDRATASNVIEGFASTGNVSLQGNLVVGIAGLSVEPSRHRIELDLGRRWTWCALDAVGIVGAIGDGVIYSEMADGRVQLDVKSGGIESDQLAVLVPDGYGMTSSVDEWCPLANFFPIEASATGWAESHGVKGQAIPVTVIAPQLIERWRTVLNHYSPE